MEEFMYEARPYVCGIIGTGAIFVPETVGRACGIVLVVIGIHIWRKRKIYRDLPWLP